MDARTMNATTTTTTNETLYNAADSWREIYVSVALTVLQVGAFLLIFECARRSQAVGETYNRRRQQRPQRTPPELMQEHGCAGGWLAFEWWRVRVADESYNAMAQHETVVREQRKKEKAEQQAMRRRALAEHPFGLEHDQELVGKAERQVYERSPFFDPTESDNQADHAFALPQQQQEGAATASIWRPEEEEEEKEETVETAETSMTVSSAAQVDKGKSSYQYQQEFQPQQQQQQQQNANGHHAPHAEHPSGDTMTVSWTATDEPNDSATKLPPRPQCPPSPPAKSPQKTMPNNNDTSHHRKIPGQSLHNRVRSLPLLPRLKSTESEPAALHQKEQQGEIIAEPLSYSERPAQSRVRRAMAGASYTARVPLTIGGGHESPASCSSPQGSKRRVRFGNNGRSGVTKNNADEDPDDSKHSNRSGSLWELIAGSNHQNKDERRGESQKNNKRNDMRKRSNSCNSNHSVWDMPFGSDRNRLNRLAQIRYEDQTDMPNWDTHLSSAVSIAFWRFMKNTVLKITDRSPDPLPQPQQQNAGQADVTSGTSTREQTIVNKVQRRPLDKEQQELLRCIGVDAFMTLRFLIFGFDVSFWPLIFSLVTIIPTFASGSTEVQGFWRTTVLALENGSNRFWVVVLFAWVHFCYILRRIWIEWELFIPLRYDFLESGDFEKVKYQEQYRRTCVVEYVPKSHRKSKCVYEFFDAIFPGAIHRAEVLLNTEHLHRLLEARLKHIVAYEDAYARLVHQQADYLRTLEAIEKSGPIKRCCRRKIIKPKEPQEPKIIVSHHVRHMDMQNRFMNKVKNKTVNDARTHKTLPWHHYNIRRLNKEIEDEYLRLAMHQQRSNSVIKKESWLSRWLGLRYVTGSSIEPLHSSTAFVEFTTLSTKQYAIQCNLTGTNNFFEVKQVAEIRDVKWENAHVARSFVETRKRTMSILLFGGLLAWSFIVAAIRSVDNMSEWFRVQNKEILAVIFDLYLPAMVVEGLVRAIPLIMRVLSIWIRFKSTSETDRFILHWYTAYRLFTFVFVLFGGTLVDSGSELLNDPLQFLRKLSENVAINATFFASYVNVAGSIQVFFRLSQVHNLMLYWFTKNIITEEATSQRRLEKMRTTVPNFHLEEFIPLFLFIFMVGALYGSIAPLACFFVAAFFKCAYHVFRYMALFVYSNGYESGGSLFYTLSNVLFYVLYLLVLIIASYLSLHGNNAMAGLLLPLTVVIFYVHRLLHRTFVVPSMTLSLTKARISDESKGSRGLRVKQERKRAAKQVSPKDLDPEDLNEKLVPLLRAVDETQAGGSCWDDSGGSNSKTDNSNNGCCGPATALANMEKRYREEEMDDADAAISDFTASDESGLPQEPQDFFIYRQPYLNRATWEYAPRPYRDNLNVQNDDFSNTHTGADEPLNERFEV